MLHLIFLPPWLCFFCYFSLCSSCLDFPGYEAIMGSEAMGWRDSEGFGHLESVYPVEATKGLVDQCLSIWTESGLHMGYHYCQWSVWQRMAGWLRRKLEWRKMNLRKKWSKQSCPRTPPAAKRLCHHRNAKRPLKPLLKIFLPDFFHAMPPWFLLCCGYILVFGSCSMLGPDPKTGWQLYCSPRFPCFQCC